MRRLFPRTRVLLQSLTVMTAAAAAEQESGGITEGAKPHIVVISIEDGGEKACRCHARDGRIDEKACSDTTQPIARALY